jgi:LysR family transcriptional regulator, hydrogen peroxide-inducible genes activator
MDLYQLRYFLSVVDNGSFTKAALRSNISQPSLSQQILNLEDELGQKLFHRISRRISLTDAGQLLAERARRILREADTTLEELKDNTSLGRRVYVGAVPTIASFFFPAVIAYCQTNDLHIRLRSFENFRPVIVDLLLNGELDWGLVSMPIGDPRLAMTTLFKEPLLLALADKHPLARRDKVNFADLREENFILLGDASSLTAQIQRIGDDHRFEPTITHRCAQLTTVKTLTAMGLGISVLPQSARSAIDPAGLVYRRFSGRAPMRETVLVRHRRRHLSKGALLFAEAARAVVGPAKH